jgi:hypothetical protein
MYIIRQTTLFAVLGFICISPSKHSRHSTDEVIRLTAPYSSISFTAGSCLSGPSPWQPFRSEWNGEDDIILIPPREFLGFNGREWSAHHVAATACPTEAIGLAAELSTYVERHLGRLQGNRLQEESQLPHSFVRTGSDIGGTPFPPLQLSVSPLDGFERSQRFAQRSWKPHRHPRDDEGWSIAYMEGTGVSATKE